MRKLIYIFLTSILLSCVSRESDKSCSQYQVVISLINTIKTNDKDVADEFISQINEINGDSREEAEFIFRRIKGYLDTMQEIKYFERRDFSYIDTTEVTVLSVQLSAEGSKVNLFDIKFSKKPGSLCKVIGLGFATRDTSGKMKFIPRPEHIKKSEL